MLTVRELLRDLDVGVLAGEANLDAPVRWVHISELADFRALLKDHLVRPRSLEIC